MANSRHKDNSPHFDLLSIALTSRAPTVSQLAELISDDEDNVLRNLKTLERLGFLELSGQNISYLPPQIAIAERADQLLAQATSTIEQSVLETKELLATAPMLLSSWNEHSSYPSGSCAQVFHGAFAPTDLWLQVAATRKLKTTDGILPEARRLFAASQRQQRVWYEAIADEHLQVRAIISSRDTTSPGATEVISADMEVGAEFRMLPAPPSWLWIADDDIVGLPFRWGEVWPTSVFATSDPAVVSLTRWLYDRLWAEAAPVVSDRKEWDAILALMNQGATLEAASHSLEMSARTGRRRIAAALEHFGVDGMFALGAAWQRERQTRGST